MVGQTDYFVHDLGDEDAGDGSATGAELPFVAFSQRYERGVTLWQMVYFKGRRKT